MQQHFVSSKTFTRVSHHFGKSDPIQEYSSHFCGQHHTLYTRRQATGSAQVPSITDQSYAEIPHQLSTRHHKLLLF